MKKLFLQTILSLLLLQVFGTISDALEVDTHKAINEYIARNSLNGFSLGTYLKNQLGFANGEDEKINSLKVWELVCDGGRYEDKPPLIIPYTRSLNHFHDPLKSWDTAGFQGTFKSSLVWAQNQGALANHFGGDNSWKRARKEFINGGKA